MAKRRSDTELTRDNVGSFLEDDDESSRSRRSEPAASFERADSATLQKRTMYQLSNGTSLSSSSPAEGSSNPFKNVRLSASSSVPSSSASGQFSFGRSATEKRGNASPPNSIPQLLQHHQERIGVLVNQSEKGVNMGSWTGLMFQFSKQMDRLTAGREPPPNRPNPPPPPPAAAAPSNASTVGVTFGSFAPPPCPPPAATLPPPIPPVPLSTVRTDDATEPGAEEEKGEGNTVHRIADPDWRDVGDFEEVRMHRGQLDGDFVSVGSGLLRLQKHIEKPEARLIQRDPFGMKTLLCVRLSPGQTFTLRESPPPNPGKKQFGFIFFVGTTDRGMEKLRLRKAMPGATELHQKLQELVQ
jgi:NUP50 (Nucleoporin 50 kDa)